MKDCLYLNWKSKNLTTAIDKNNEKIFSCPKKLFPSPLALVIQCCINPKSHYCTSKASPATLKKGKRMGREYANFVWFFSKILSRGMQWFRSKVYYFITIVFLIGSNAPVMEKVKRAYASWLPSQHPAMLQIIEKEGSSIKPSVCGNWHYRIEEKGRLSLVTSQDLVSNFNSLSADMGSL